MVGSSLAIAVIAATLAWLPGEAAGLGGAALATQNNCDSRRSASRSIVASRADDQARSDLGLRARLNRSAGIYTLNEVLRLEIETDISASIEVWNVAANNSSSRIAPLSDDPLISTPGEPLRLPEALGNSIEYRLGPPTGPNEIIVTARALPASSRSAEFQPNRVARGQRQDLVLCFTILEQP